MPISTRNKIIFIHIPKNAGTFIVESYNLYDKFHHKYDYYIKKYGIKFLMYKKFAVVRNPLDRLISCYEYARMPESYYHSVRNPESAVCGVHPDYYFLKDKTFEEMVDYLPNLIKNKKSHPGWKPQYYWVCDEQDNVMVDFLIRYERLEQGLRRMNQIMGINVDIKMKRINFSYRKDFYDYYRTAELIEKVYKIYRKDFELFDYSSNIKIEMVDKDSIKIIERNFYEKLMYISDFVEIKSVYCLSRIRNALSKLFCKVHPDLEK